MCKGRPIQSAFAANECLNLFFEKILPFHLLFFFFVPAHGRVFVYASTERKTFSHTGLRERFLDARKERAPRLFISIFHDLFPDRYQSPFTFARKSSRR
jgi:hypothetical protein